MSLSPSTKEVKKSRSESKDSSLSYSPIQKNPERYAHLSDDREKRKRKEKKDIKGKSKDTTKLMPRVRLRSSSSEDNVELPPEPLKVSPEQRDSEARALQLLKAKAKESLEKKIPAKAPKQSPPKTDFVIDIDKKKPTQVVVPPEVEKIPTPSKRPEFESNSSDIQVKVEDIAIPEIPPLPASTPPLPTRKPTRKSRDSSSGSDSDR